jgi:predicted RNA-binding Zn-ribbon protein involved in translation (DUF1610 family)
MSLDKSGACWNCGADLGPSDYGRQDRCPQCGQDAHVCLNCEFHDPAYNNECRESQAERVVDKDRSSFCDYFRPARPESAKGASRKDPRAAAEALFKKKD